MVQRASFLFALLLLCPIAAFADDFPVATPEELAMKDVPWSPGASAVVLDWNVRHDDEASRAIETMRIKVLKEEGKKYGDIELVSIPYYQNVRAIRARTIAPDGTITEFKGKIYDKIVVKTGGFRVLKKTLTLPNVVPGSIVEYRYAVEWPTSQLRTNRWSVQREIPIRHAEFWIKPWSEGVTSSCLTKGLPAGQKPVLKKDHFEFAIDNVAAFNGEPLAPPEEELKPRIEFYYIRGARAEYWNETAKSMTEYIEDYIGNRGPVKKAAGEITAGATTDEEKLKKIYAYVQGLRNLSYEREKTEQEEKREKLKDNNDIGDVLRNGYGYSRQLNRLFTGLARAAGLTATTVLVADRDELIFSKELPDVDQLSGEIVAVSVGGKDVYFDPGTPHTPYGMLPWARSAAQAMRLKTKKEWEWLQTPDQPVSMAVTSRSADLSLVDGVIKGTATLSYSGQEAQARRLDAKNEDDAAHRKAFEDEMKSLLPEGSIVKMTKLDAIEGVDEPVTVSFDVELPNLGTLTGSRALVPMSVFGAAAKNPFAAETRAFPIYFRYQHEVNDSITLHMPAGYAVESLPKTAKADLGALAYIVQHAQNGDALTMQRKLTFRTTVIGSEHYKTLRKFFGDLITADHDAVVLKKAGA
ncbi:MAG TPA: DUF3857 and transglutaminase domain-containing protein [Thermoanaerobaculia bacterium]|nr:DUF3857 and transglutaminase domain-containing protein [Thermoanaerobaculia bacterium]